MDTSGVSESYDILNRMVSGDVVIVEVFIYWVVSVAIITVIDIYARKKLRNKAEAYLSLRLPKFVTASAISITSIAIIIYSRQVDIRFEMLSFLGVPFLGFWFYYLVSVLRRIRAEK